MEITTYNDFIEVEEPIYNARDFDDEDEIDNYLFNAPEFTTCKYCNNDMSVKKSDYLPGSGKLLYCCKGCNWWYVMDIYNHSEDYSDPGCMTGHLELNQTQGILRRFDGTSNELPMGVLKSELLKREDLIFKIHPEKMEKLVQSVFSDFFKCEVEHLGRSGDGGIDLIMVRGNKEFAVQVKRRTKSQQIEDVSEIRAFLGALMLKQKVNGMFITTGKDFANGCYTSAELAKSLGYVNNLDLYNRERFLSMFRATNKQTNPWDRFFKLGV